MVGLLWFGNKNAKYLDILCGGRGKVEQLVHVELEPRALVCSPDGACIRELVSNVIQSGVCMMKPHNNNKSTAAVVTV